ncbi:hypothetical protein [Amycolatopsis sp. NPDC059657]|uniref:hypothetical protein n=1 Tax=Amycolatopsis sp. NPDC059657 TaxID=3346899 RepID=UPI00367189C9
MSIGADSFGDPLDARGRHRRNGAGTWTPAVSAHPDHGRHELHDDNPFYPSVSGSLPRAERQTRPLKADYGFLPIRGELPVPRPPVPRPPRRPAAPLPQPRADEPTAETPVVAPPPEPVEDQASRRTKIKLTQPVRPPRREEEDDVRVYLAPAPDGLGTFDLGSVPASVTPPKTWKKAAWFATISSGGVVVALLFAGSLLVGSPTENQASNQGWPGYRGGQPSVSDEQKAPPSPTASATKPSGGGGKNQASTGDRKPVIAGAPRDGGMMPPAAPSGGGGPVTTGAPAPNSPQKPPVTPPARTTTSAPWYSFPIDSQSMGDNTEKFFNTVAEDPNTASSVTTGKLRDQGPQALAQKYADVAYFEVKKISIDQNRGVTVNTVEVTHKDGSKTLETRTLTFGDDAKIESDGR